MNKSLGLIKTFPEYDEAFDTFDINSFCALIMSVLGGAADQMCIDGDGFEHNRPGFHRQGFVTLH